jgi:N-acetylneuraminic acid mutarotase
VFGGNYRYDFATDTWTESGLGSPSVVRYSAAAVNLNNRMLVLGGQNLAMDALRDAESYDPAASSWAAVPQMLRARKNFAAVALNNKVYAIGGANAASEPMSNVEVYTP